MYFKYVFQLLVFQVLHNTVTNRMAASFNVDKIQVLMFCLFVVWLLKITDSVTLHLM